MNKTALKNFATYARKKLRTQVQQGAHILGESTYLDRTLEASVYVWFHRFIVIRYMEVNQYLPSNIRVLSSLQHGVTRPDILEFYSESNLPIDNDAVREKLLQDDEEGAYRAILIGQCNQLNTMMPSLFEPIDVSLELLLPENLLQNDSVIRHLVADIDESDFREGVEVLGWLYQYFMSEDKDRAFAGLRQGERIRKEDIPVATQLFTPEWIVQYMVQNSVGRRWLESHPTSLLWTKWTYYLPDSEQSPAVREQLDKLSRTAVDPKEITVMDPACGSGNILVYAFDLLYQIYDEQGYRTQDIPYLIFEYNLFGLDIDDRAAQLSVLSLLLKARAFNANVLESPPTIHVAALVETSPIDVERLGAVLYHLDIEDRMFLENLLDVFVDARNLGSLIHFNANDVSKLERCLDIAEMNLSAEREKSVEGSTCQDLCTVQKVLEQSRLLSRRYEVVVTNPPYLGFKSMNRELSQYVSKYFPTAKGDLFAAFMKRMEDMVKTRGFLVTVTMQSWMFLSLYEKFRTQLIEEYSIISLVHMANMVMGIAFGTAATVLRKGLSGYRGVYQYVSQSDLRHGVPGEFPVRNQRLKITNAVNFKDIPGSPIAYWASQRVREIFCEGRKVSDYAVTRLGMATGNNDRFVRYWHEVPVDEIEFGATDRLQAQQSQRKWFPYNKGGKFRKWYGNNWFVVNWFNDGWDIRNYRNKTSHVKSHNYNLEYIFKEGVSWSFVSSSKFASRMMPKGYLFDVAGSSLFTDREHMFLICALLNSKMTYELLKYLNPTLNFQTGNIASLPLLVEDKEVQQKIVRLAKSCVTIAQDDWDSYETSWDFSFHPWLLQVPSNPFIEQRFKLWEMMTYKRFERLKAHEEELNQIFIRVYGLDREFRPELDDDEITVQVADRERDTKSFLSYVIGCLMGRYSCDFPGVMYAGGSWDDSKYPSLKPVTDGIILLTDKARFADDLVHRIEEFLAVTFGLDAVETNLNWLAQSLSMHPDESPGERLRRYFHEEFYKDHCRTYHRRPIYWLFDSGENRAFRALVYMHRFTPETLGRLQGDDLQRLQSEYQAELQAVTQRIREPSCNRDMKAELLRHVTDLQLRQQELFRYEKTLSEFSSSSLQFNPDDGVTSNYAKFQSLLAPIK